MEKTQVRYPSKETVLNKMKRSTGGLMTLAIPWIEEQEQFFNHTRPVDRKREQWKKHKFLPFLVSNMGRVYKHPVSIDGNISEGYLMPIFKKEDGHLYVNVGEGMEGNYDYMIAMLVVEVWKPKF